MRTNAALPRLIVALGGVAFAHLALAMTLECRVTDGVYRPPGATTLVSAQKRDPTTVGKVFFVDTGKATVSGSPIFRTEGKRVQVIANTEDSFEVLWLNKGGDVTALRVHRFEGAWTFSHYVSWFGLLLTGQCQ